MKYTSLILVLLFASCSSNRVIPDSPVLVGVKKLRLATNIDPILVKATSGEVNILPELFLIALQSDGYEVCNDNCEPDAIASLSVTQFETTYGRSTATHLLLGAMTPSSTAAHISFDFTIERASDHEIIFHLPVKKGDRMPLRDLAARLVQHVKKHLPAADK